MSGNCYKVGCCSRSSGIDYERRELDVVDRSDRAEVLGDLNPALRVPTLVLDDGRPLAESNAIIWYFAEGTPYLPEDRFERAKVLQWLFFEQYDHEPTIAVVRFWVASPGITPAAAEIEARRRGGYARSRARAATSRSSDVPRRRPLHDRRHRAVRLHARRARGRLRPRRATRRSAPGSSASPRSRATSRSPTDAPLLRVAFATIASWTYAARPARLALVGGVNRGSATYISARPRCKLGVHRRTSARCAGGGARRPLARVSVGRLTGAHQLHEVVLIAAASVLISSHSASP